MVSGDGHGLATAAHDPASVGSLAATSSYAGQPGEATGPLQRGLMLAPMLQFGPLMLLLAHGLTKDQESAKTVLGGMDATELLESLLD